MPVIFGCTLILIILIHYEVHKNAASKENVQDFLKREFEANTARKKDISGLPYLTARTDALPDLSHMPDPEGELGAALASLKKMDGAKMLNLSGISNTDLKLEYGAANFDFLSACDTNYTVFMRTLQKLGKLLADAGADREAVQTLEYALELDTDVISTYRLLASLYRKARDEEALDRLRQKAQDLPEETRTAVLPYIL